MQFAWLKKALERSGNEEVFSKNEKKSESFRSKIARRKSKEKNGKNYGKRNYNLLGLDTKKLRVKYKYWRRSGANWRIDAKKKKWTWIRETLTLVLCSNWCVRRLLFKSRRSYVRHSAFHMCNKIWKMKKTGSMTFKKKNNWKKTMLNKLGTKKRNSL